MLPVLVALYHALKREEYEVIVLVNWGWGESCLDKTGAGVNTSSTKHTDGFGTERRPPFRQSGQALSYRQAHVTGKWLKT